MRIDVAAQTDIGRRKKNNEDYYGVFKDDTQGLRLFDEGALLCVADGLGGHVGGEIASKLAVSHMKDVLKESSPAGSDNAEEENGLLPLLKTWVVRANTSVHQTNQDLVKTGRPMGTTLLACILSPRRVFIGNVGDSRCYLIRDGEIVSKTEDHSWVDEQVKLGLMSRAEAEVDARRHMVTRSIGTHPEVDVDTYGWDIVPGDTLLLCTDGLVNMVKDSEICQEFKGNASPAEIAHRLIDKANDNGGKDNITVIVADISPSLATMARRRVLSFSKRRGAKMVWLALAVLYGLGCLGIGFLLGSRFGGELTQ